MATLSDAELAALASGKMSGLSDATLAMLAKPDMPVVAPTPAPKAPSTDRTWGEAITDLGLAVAKGGAQTLQIPGKIQRLVTGTGSPEEGLEGYAKRSEDISTSLQSEGLKARDAQRQAKIDEAEKEGGVSGFLKSASTAAFETIKDPALLSTFLFEQLPQLVLTRGVGKAAQAANALRMTLGKATVEEVAKTSLKVGVSADIAAGALLQGVDVGADAFDKIYKYGIAQGLSDEAARDLALNKARAAAAAAAVISLGAQNLPGAKKMEEALLGGVGKKPTSIPGALGRGAVAGAQESFSEGIEEGGGALAGNVAVQQADPTQALMQGVGSATGLGAVGGFGMSAPISTMAAMPGKQPKVAKVPEAIVKDALQTGAAPDEVIARVAQVYQNQGILAEEALALATREVAEAAEAAAKAAAKAEQDAADAQAASVDARVADLFDELTANGVPVAEAKVQAVKQAAEEEQNDAEAAAEEQNATVNPTVNGADQRSDGVPVSSDATAGTTASAGTPPVEGTPVAAGSTTGGEGTKPAALNLYQAKYENLPNSDNATHVFTTAKGSVYEQRADGTTVRDKQQRPEHVGEKEKGLQPASLRTIFVQKPMVIAPVNSPTVLRPTTEGKVARFYSADYGPHKVGEMLPGTETSFTTVPEVGLSPIEIFTNGSVHFGNAITEVKPVKAKAAAPAAPVTETKATSFSLNKIPQGGNKNTWEVKDNNGTVLSTHDNKIAANLAIKAVRAAQATQAKPVVETEAPAPAPAPAITSEPAPNAFSKLVRMEYGEPISLVAKNKTGEEVGRLTYMPNGGPIDVFVREQDRRKGIATALYAAHKAAGGKLLSVDSGVAISDEARAVRAAKEEKPIDVSDILEYLEKRDELIKQLDEAGEESSALLDKIFDLDSVRSGSVLGADGKPLVLDENGKYDSDKKYEAIKTLETELAKASAKFDVVSKQLDELDAARAVAKTQGTETKAAAPVTETKVKTTPAGLVSVKKVKLETPVGRRQFEYQVLSPTGEVVSTHGTQVEASKAATAERAKANAVTGKQKAGPKTKLTPEQVIENRKATNAQTNINKKNTRTLETTVKGIKETLDRDLDVVDAADDAELKTIAEDHGVARVAAIAEAMRITENRLLKDTKEGEAAAELLGHKTITDNERLKAINKLRLAKGEKLLFNLPSRSTKNTTKALSDSTNGNDDAKYLKFETATQALISISKDKNSTSFEKYLSNLLAFFVRDIRIVVVNENTVLPEKVRKEFDADAGGVYFKRVIYLAADGGINNTVFLHEVLHGALNNRLIAFFKATQEGRRIDKKFAAAVENIFSIMESANAEYNALEKVGMLDERLRLLKKGGAFTNIFEFIAYGMSNPVMQEFLLQSEGTYTQKNAPNLFTRFVNGLLDFFGMGPEHKSAMQDLILSTNALLANPTGGPAILREAARPSAARKARAAKVKVDKALEQVAQSNNAGDIGNVVGASADDHDAFKNEAIARWDALNNASQKLMLGAMQTSDILKWKGDEIPGIVGIDALAQKVASTRDNMLSKFSALAEPFAKFVRKFGQKTLGDTMHLARLKSVPVTEYKDRADALVNDALVKYYEKKLTSTTLTPQVRGMTAKALSDRKVDIGVVFDAWDKLGKQEGGHKTYAMVRKFYIDNKNLTRAVLNRQLDELPIAADAKAELLKSVRLLYENVESDETGDSTELQKAKQSVQEYFPFSRYGNYWLRVASGTKGTVGAETYFFENGTDRNKYLISRAKELNISKEDSSVFSIGDDVSVLRKKFSSESIMLQKMFATIDAAKLTTDAERDALKDQLYQTYLLTLPERSIRKQFLHAKERTGFTNDVFRNFQTYSQRYASQIPKLLYGDKIRNAISASRDNIKDQPTTQRGTNELFLNAIARRAEDVLNPPEPNKIVTFSSRFAFLWLLTSPASAATQMATIPIMVLPALNAEYGYAQTAAKTAKYLNIWKSLGKTVVGPNGETTFTAPSVGASQIVTSDPIKQRAFQLGQERSIFMTNTSVLTSTVRSPGSSKASLPGHVLEKTYNIMTALFNGAERISRESTYMMVFELEYAKTKDFDASVNKAVELTHELLFRYDPANRPDILKSNLGRTLLQFKMYAVGMTSFLLRNAYNSMRISGISGQERVKAMHKLAGTLVMGSVFHGLVGMPLYSTICLAIDAVLSALGDDEEEKKRRRHSPLTADNSDMRFRYEYLPENFGTITMPGLDMRQHRLSEVLEKGLISSLTDVNIGSRTSFDNLWFRNPQPGKDWSETATNIATSLMGPSASAGVNIVKGIDDFGNGHILRGLEKISPAFFRGAAAAIRMGTEGAETKRGDDMLKPAEINTANLVAQVLGFTPARLARIQEQNNAASQELMVAKGKRSALLKRFDEAVTDREGDKSKIKGIIEDIKRHNKRYPSESLVITGDTIDASLTAFINRSQMTIRGQTMIEKDMPMLIRGNRAAAPFE